MLRTLLFTYYLGLPVLAWGGIFLFIFLLTTVTIGLLANRGKIKISVHQFFAFTTLTLAMIHGILGLLAFI